MAINQQLTSEDWTTMVKYFQDTQRVAIRLKRKALAYPLHVIRIGTEDPEARKLLVGLDDTIWTCSILLKMMEDV